MQSPFPLGLNDNIYKEGYNSKMPNFDAFHGKRINGNIKHTVCTENA